MTTPRVNAQALNSHGHQYRSQINHHQRTQRKSHAPATISHTVTLWVSDIFIYRLSHMSRIQLNQDPIRDLNDHLRDHPSGNLTPLLSWALEQSGPDHQKTHYATAKCESVFQLDLEPCGDESCSQRQGNRFREWGFHRPCQEGSRRQSPEYLAGRWHLRPSLHQSLLRCLVVVLFCARCGIGAGVDSIYSSSHNFLRMFLLWKT